MAAPRRAMTSTMLRTSARAATCRPVSTVASRSSAAAALRSVDTGTRTSPLYRSGSAVPVCWRLAAPTATAAGLGRGRGRWYSTESEIPGVRLWSFEEVKEQATSGKDNGVVIVDVREPHELQETGKIPGAINIPMTQAAHALIASEADFEDAYGFERPAKDATLMIYCRAGVRARTAAALAQAAGWSDLAVYPGSWLDWAKQGGPVEAAKGGKGK